jgi:hypothetical protein
MTHENNLVKVPPGIWEKQGLKGRSHLNPKDSNRFADRLDERASQRAATKMDFEPPVGHPSKRIDRPF